MANPNIVNVTAIYGQLAVQAVTTSATAIVTNSAASNKVLKINALYISNIVASNANITIDIFRSSTAYRLVKDLIVPTGSTINVLDKSIYLLEGDSLRVTASANSSLEAVCSYEDIN